MPRKRIVAWSAAVGVLLIVILIIGGYYMLQTARFHRYLLAKIVQQMEESTGGQVEARNFEFHLSKLTANLYGLTIHGTEPAEQRPFLQVDELTVGLRILSVLHRRVNLRQIVIRHPIVHLLVAENGHNNIPQSNRAPKSDTSPTNLFDLAVGHVLVSQGEIYYNDRHSSVDADVYDLRTEIDFDSSAIRYSGAISYRDGEVKYAGLDPLPHSLAVQFDATPAGLHLSPLVLTVGSSRIALQANIADYSNPRADAHYNILIQTQDFARLSPAALSGAISLSGTLHYRNLPHQPILRDVSLDGQLSGNALLVSAPQGKAELRKLFARYELADGNLQARDVSVELLNGKVTGNASLQHLDRTPAAKVHAALEGISIAAAKAALKAPGSQTLPLTGSMIGSVDASWAGAVAKVRAQSDVAIRGAIGNRTTSGVPEVPLNGAIHINYDGSKSLITIQPSVIRTPSTSIAAQGTVSTQPGGRSDLGMQASTSNLHEWGVLASMVQATQGNSSRARTSQAAPDFLSLSGTATLSATVLGSLPNPQVRAQFNGQNLQWEGSQISSLQLSVQASPSGIEVQNGSLVTGTQANAKPGQVAFSARVGLRNWSYGAANPMAANVSVKQLPIAQLEQLANMQYPISGILSGSIVLQGSQLNPIGHGSLEITRASAYDEPIQSLQAEFQAANGSVTSSFHISLAAGAATANLVFVPKTTAYQVRLEAPGITLTKLHALQGKYSQFAGTVRARASGSGTLNNPQVTATVEIPQLQLQQTTISEIKAQVNVANQQADLSLTTSVAQASLQAHARLNLTGNYDVDARLDSSKIPLEPLLAIYVPSASQGFQGETELHATLKGPLKDKTRLEAHLVVPTLTASYQQLNIQNSGPIRADYANSVIVLQPSEIKGTETSLRFDGRVPVNRREPMNLNAQGSVNLRLLRMVDPDIKSAGGIDLEVHTAGNGERPEVAGQIKIRNVSLSTTTAPVGLDGLNGTLDLRNDRIQITQLNGQVGGGDISLGGAIIYQPQLQFNLALQGKAIRLRYPDGVRSVLDSDLNLTGNMQEASVNGRVLIGGLSFTSDFDLSKFMSQFTGAEVPPSGSSFADNVKLNVSVQSVGDLSATSSTVSIEGSVNLRLLGTASNPVIVGRTDLTSGDIFFMSRRYQLQRGIINFTNPNRIEPVVNLSIATIVEQYNLTLNITGPVDKLQIGYSSDPPLAPVDIINLIARGQTTEEAGTTNFGADSILASGVASQLGSGVQKLAGISSLQIDPLIGGNNTNPSARIALQQRVTKNFVFTFSTDVTQPQGEIVQGDYQLTKRWSVSAERDEYGGFTAEGRFHTSF
jgi:translocation and assembly module TamB